MKSIKAIPIVRGFLTVFDAVYLFISILAIIFDSDYIFLIPAAILTIYTAYILYWRIDFDEEHFVYRTIFRKTLYIKYNEFINTKTIHIKHKGVTIEYLVIYSGFHKIIVNKSNENVAEFEYILNKQIKEARNVRTIS